MIDWLRHCAYLPSATCHAHSWVFLRDIQYRTNGDQ
jgi:hypothetical protein